MKRKLLIIVALWLSTVVLMALQKPVFLLYYAHEAAQSSWSEWLQVIWHGLKLDMTVAGYITSLPILFLIFTEEHLNGDTIGKVCDRENCQFASTL